MAYIYLMIAIVAEVIATSALKASNGFTQWIPSSITVLGYLVAIYFFGIDYENHSRRHYLRPLVWCRHHSNFMYWLGFL